MKIKDRFHGNKIKITRIRMTPDLWYGNAVHFQYEGKTYRASIREDPDSEDESGNRVRYAHLQIADRFGTWGNDIATKDFEDEILIPLKDFAIEARNKFLDRYRSSRLLDAYNQSIPYKFYDNNAFADYLNSIFVE